MSETNSSREGAGPRRQQRAAAARLLGRSTRRANLDWADLLKLPAWATLPRTELEQLAWRVGVWHFSHELQQSIDGRLLSHIRSCMGDGAFNALITSTANANHSESSAGLPLQTSDSGWDALFRATGHVGLLCTIDSDRLRLSLGEVLWPDEPEVHASVRRPWWGSQAVSQAMMCATGAATPPSGEAA
jgi:hypothetical protein